MKRNAGSLTTEGGELCPVCGRPARRAAVLPEYRLFGCDHCGCWSSDALVRGADTSFETHHYFENAALDEGKWETLLRRLRSRDQGLHSILDVGCGTGAFLSFVAREYPEIRCEGIEIDPGRVAQARKANPRARIHEGDASSSLAEASGPFDLITLWDVFEHVTAPVQLLSRLAQSLSAAGSIHIVTINEHSVLPTLGRFSSWLSRGRLSYPLRRTHEAHHLVFFTLRGLEIAAEEARLSIRDVSYDRLRRGRMDGHPAVTAATAGLLWLENLLGNGLFVNLTLGAPTESPVGSSSRAHPQAAPRSGQPPREHDEQRGAENPGGPQDGHHRGFHSSTRARQRRVQR